MKASWAATLLVLAGIASVCLGQIPSAEQCEDSFDDSTEEALTSSLTPCAIGAVSPGDACCSALTATVNVNSGNPLAGCLCQQSIVDQIGGVLASNTLAAAVGFDINRLTQVLTTCGADFVGNNGCNQAAPTPAPVPTPSVPTPEPTPTPTPTPTTPAPRPKATGPGIQRRPVTPPGIVKVADSGDLRGEPQVVYKTAPQEVVVKRPVYTPEYQYHGPFPILHGIKNHIHRKIGSLLGHHRW